MQAKPQKARRWKAPSGPFFNDPHLAEGTGIDLSRLRPDTRKAATDLAAHVVQRLED